MFSPICIWNACSLGIYNRKIGKMWKLKIFLHHWSSIVSTDSQVVQYPRVFSLYCETHKKVFLQLEQQVEAEELSNSILIEISRSSVSKWQEKLNTRYGWNKTENCKNIIFEVSPSNSDRCQNKKDPTHCTSLNCLLNLTFLICMWEKNAYF